MKNELLDLAYYATQGIGGIHGLYDVSEGTVTLGKFGLPYCKVHGDMIKVSKDGIWRCLDPIHHGCYFDNAK